MRLLVGKKVWVSPGSITHTEYVVSCANDYSYDYNNNDNNEKDNFYTV